jgi:NAD(P)-dependent dehydrogenase (short-subunit alcohol dehydrogenase family)
MKGKTVLITGGNAGIGKAAATALAKLGATVILGCRDGHKGQAARDEIAAATQNQDISVLSVDVSSLASVRAAAEQLAKQHSKLDVLVNNAGAWFPDRTVTKDGLELQWATNVVGPHLLTLLLLPLLEKSGAGRIINVASTAAGGLDLDDPNIEKKSYNGVNVYSTTKQANRMLTWALARRLAGNPVVANALSPGLVGTDLNRNSRGFFKWMFKLLLLFARTPERGADTIVWLASDPAAGKATGTFFIDRKATKCKFADPVQEDKLWAIATKPTGETALAS